MDTMIGSPRPPMHERIAPISQQIWNELIAAVGGVLERHRIGTGFRAAPERLLYEDHGMTGVMPLVGGGVGMLCPKCSQRGVVKEGACMNCRSCGWSKCT